MKLGIAGGPLIIAILIGRFGHRMKLNTYTTTSANMMLREIGLVLFLASVGIKAGANFWNTVVEGDGLLYVLTGFIITIIPILIVGTIARMKYKFNYFTIMGMLAVHTPTLSPRLRQLCLLTRGSCYRLFYGLSVEYVPAYLHSAARCAVLLRIITTRPLVAKQ